MKALCAGSSSGAQEGGGDSMFRSHKVTSLDSLAGIAIKYGVGRCRLTGSKPVLKATIVSALETVI